MVDISVEIQEALVQIGETYPEKKNYLEFLSAVTQEELEELDEKLSRSGVLGSTEFIEQVEEEIKKRESEGPSEEKPQRIILPFVSFTLLIIAAGVVVGSIYYYRTKREKIIFVTEKIVSVPAPAPEIPKELLKVKLEQLDGTEWIMELIPEQSQVDALYPNFDRLTFREGTVQTGYLTSEGFPPSNYNLITREDGSLIWETMQRNPRGDKIIWRGEEKDGTMRGTFRRRFSDGRSENVAFKSPGYFKVVP